MTNSSFVTRLALVALAGCAPLSCAFAQQTTPPSPPPMAATPTAPVLTTSDLLSAVAWVQSSVEARASAKQAYFLGKHQLDVALRDKSWTAATEQTQPFKKLPPAIILDLDETVLDNSAFMARQARDNADWSDARWDKWVAEAQAPALPGAVSFLNYAASKGVQIFYVSNRTSDGEAATRENLRRLGCPLQGPEDHVLLAGEKPQWTSDKTTRRQFVAQNHRVLLLFGDDLNDFVTGRPLTLQQRAALYSKYSDNWGERWIVLSNPLYGSWEDAIYNYKYDLSRQEMLRLKYGALQYLEPLSTAPMPASALPPVPPASPATR